MKRNDRIFQSLTNKTKPQNLSHIQELSMQLDSITTITSDSNTNWRIRQYALIQLGELILGNFGHDPILINSINNKLYLNLINQLSDLHHSIVKTTCLIIEIAAEELNLLIEPAIEQLMSSTSLYKYIVTSNETSSNIIGNTLYQIIRHVPTSNIIKRVCAQVLSLNFIVRLCCIYQLDYILWNYSPYIISQAQQIIEDAIKLILRDISKDLRKVGRKLYFTYLYKYNGRACVLYNLLENSIQKDINEDKRNGLDLEILEPNDTIELSDYYKINVVNEGESLLKNMKMNNDDNDDIDYNYDGNPIEVVVGRKDCKKDKITKRGNLIVYESSIQRNKKKNKNNNNDKKKKNINCDKSPEEKIIEKKKIILENINKKLDELTILTSKDQSTIIPFKTDILEKLIIDQCNTIVINTFNKKKIVAFEILNKQIKEIGAFEKYLNRNIINQFIEIHIKNLLEEDRDLLKQVMFNLSNCFYYISKIFSERDINIIIKLIVSHMSLHNRQLNKSCLQVIEVIQKEINCNTLLATLTNILIAKDCNEEICYNLISPLIEHSSIILNDTIFFTNFLKLLCSSTPEIASVAYILDKLYHNYLCLFQEVFKSIGYDQKKQLKYILEIHDSFLLNKLTFEFRTISPPSNLQELSSDKVISFIKDNDIESFIDYLINKDMNEIKRFLFNLIYFSKEDIRTVLIFLFALASKGECSMILNENIHLIVDSLIAILKSNYQSCEQIKNILFALFLNVNVNNYIEIIAKNMNLGNNTMILEILLSTINRYILGKNENELLELLPLFTDAIFNMMNHELMKIRKQAAICTVDLYLILGAKFNPYMSKLTKSQQNLVNIFIKKKQGIK